MYKIVINSYTNPILCYVEKNELDKFFQSNKISLNSADFKDWLYENQSLVKSLAKKKEKLTAVC